MWEAEFYPELLDERDGIIINCPTEAAEREVASILVAHGILYPDGKSPADVVRWSGYGEEFCYSVNNGAVRRGSTRGMESSSRDWCFRCTFVGVELPDFDTATDAELKQLLGI